MGGGVEGPSGNWRRSTSDGSGRPPADSRADDERSIRALAADLPAVWHAATTTPAERQRIARLLLERVAVTVDKASERVDVELHWVGGLMQATRCLGP